MGRRIGEFHKMIPIENIYYMLSYYFKFDALNNKIKNIDNIENYDNIAELTAQILFRGVNALLKIGLSKEYILYSEPLSTLKGKIDISNSIKTMSMHKKQLICLYDNFSINFYLNRIIKTAICELLKLDIKKESKEELRKILYFFKEVETIDIYKINWNIQYNRNNQIYRILISICHLFIKGLLISDFPERKKRLFLNAPNDEKILNSRYMSELYENFILNYYAHEFKKELKSNASKIDWALDDNYREMLPKMQTDIMLTCGNKILIIDAKYYPNYTRKKYNNEEIISKDKLISENLYQIFAYVKNKNLENKNNEVSGMLLYAKTNKDNTDINETYKMSGNKISVRSLDLTCNFKDIEKQLNEIVEEHFNIVK